MNLNVLRPKKDADVLTAVNLVTNLKIANKIATSVVQKIINILNAISIYWIVINLCERKDKKTGCLKNTRKRIFKL